MEPQYSSYSEGQQQQERRGGENSEGGVGCQLNITVSLIKRSILSLQLASLISLFFLSSALLFLFLHYSLKAANSSSLFSVSSIDRNYMFLLCNGILVFLVKSSASLSNSSSSESSIIDHQVDEKVSGSDHDHYDQQQSGIRASEMKEARGMGAEEKTGDGYVSVPPSAAVESDGADDDGERSAAGLDDAEMFHGTDSSNNNNVQQQVEEESEEVEEESEEEEEEEEEGLDRDELNKRCEDFIRKMKEGIKAEAKRQMKPAASFLF